MGTAISKKSKTVVVKKTTTVKKISASKTADKAQTKEVNITLIKSKTAATPLVKKEFVEPAGRLLARSTRPVKKQQALTKEDLKKRQSSKGTSRKQGGVKYAALEEQQLKTMANKPESGPTSVA